jgi:hypothetical protein
MFHHGRKHYADGVHNLNGNDLRDFWNMYRRKYWGTVDREIWEANNEASVDMQSRGEIQAKYTSQDGTEVFIFRIADCSYAIFATQNDIDSGFVERMREQRGERNSGSSRGNRAMSISYDEMRTRILGS